MDLNGKLLIAMPGMGDPRFEHSVVFICVHSEDGSMGLIVNKPSSELQFEELLNQLDIDSETVDRDITVHFGGPVELGRGFVLHSGEYRGDASTLEIDEKFGMSATLDVLRDIAGGSGPAHALMALGYAGWGPGQLESEIQQNGWLTCDATSEIVFTTEDKNKWAAALGQLGVDALTLSSNAGRA